MSRSAFPNVGSSISMRRRCAAFVSVPTMADSRFSRVGAASGGFSAHHRRGGALERDASGEFRLLIGTERLFAVEQGRIGVGPAAIEAGCVEMRLVETSVCGGVATIGARSMWITVGEDATVARVRR